MNRHMSIYGKELNGQLCWSLKCLQYAEQKFIHDRSNPFELEIGLVVQHIFGLQIIFIIVPVVTKTLLHKVSIWHEIYPIDIMRQ